MEELRILNEQYRDGNPAVSDEEFDAKLAAVEAKLDAASYLLFRASLMEKGGDIIHQYVIGSLRKCNYGEGQLRDYVLENHIIRLLVAAKLDGMSYTAKYLNGVLIECATRGDGQTGEDITAPARFVLPNMISLKGLLEIRGEFVIPIEAVAALGYKNARNGVVGLMKKETILPERLMHVRGPVYQILNSSLSRMQQYDELELMGFEVPENYIVTVRKEISETEEILKTILVKLQDKSEYLIDGLVISSPGHVHENVALPQTMVAFKVNRDFVTTTVTGMTIETSKEGRLKGVATVEPVDINGTTISNVSVYNFKYVLENKIGAGAKVIITKAGEIIPKITEILEPGYIDHSLHWELCPSCGAVTCIDGVDKRCTADPADCPAQNVKSVTHFTRNLDILGASETSLDKWGITSVTQCLTFVPSDRNGEKFKKNFEDKVFTTSKEELFGALNWNGVGKSIFRKIFAVASIEYVVGRALNGASLGVEVEGVGDLMWDKIVAMVEKNLEIVDTIVNDTRHDFVYTIIEPTGAASLTDKSFCCTGTLSKGRKEIEAMIVDAGGEIKSVSKKLDFLVAGEKAGSKIAKAEKAGVTVITEDQLMEMLG